MRTTKLLPAVILICLLCFLTTIFGTNTVAQAAKKVGYVTRVDVTLDPTASPVDDDPIIRMLKADANFEVDVLAVAADAVVDLSGYDVVVAQESFGSTSAIFKPGGSLGLSSIPVPFVFNKPYAMRGGRGFATGTPGSGAEIEGTYTVDVDPANQGNDLFKGLTFTNNQLQLVRTGADDMGGNTRKKGVQYAIDVQISVGNTLLAMQTGAPANATVCINDIPAGETIGSETLAARMITLAFNFGAISKRNGTNLTSAGLTIWRNAIYSLAGLEVPATPVPAFTYKDVVFVSRPDKWDATNQVHPDQVFMDDLTAAGYKVIKFYNTALETADQATLDTLNNADLVILGRSCDSNIFGSTHKQAWNAVTTPMMMIHLWAGRTSRMNWFKTGTCTQYNVAGDTMNAIILEPSDPVFTGLTLTDGMLPWATSAYDIISVKNAGNGTALAISAAGSVADSVVLYARFNPWVEFYSGAVDRPAGHRTYIGNGNDAYTDPVTGATVYNYYNFTPESKQVYLAEVARMVELPKNIPEPKDIVFVSRPDYLDPHTNAQPDLPIINDLRAAGYNVITWYNTSLSTASQATVDTLLNADLVIMGRSTPSTMYQSAGDKAAWNTLPVPILNIELWNCRSSRLNWFKSTNMVNIDDSVDYDATLDVPDDPVFEGVTVTNGVVPWTFGPISVLREKSAGNGHVLARMASDSSVLFVRFDPWVEFYPGSVDRPANHRTMIGNGSDNASDAVGKIYNYYNFTEESKKVFFAEIARMVELPKNIPEPKDIVFVSRPDKWDEINQVHPDQVFIDDLKAAGYNVIKFYNTALETAGQASLDTLNNADLVILGRSCDSGIYGSTHKATWNDIKAPMLCLHSWALRNNRMNWFNTNSCLHINDTTGEASLLKAVIAAPADPVFAGLTLVDGKLPWATGPYDYIAITDPGNGKVLATSAAFEGNLEFVRFDPWVEFYPGTSDRPAGYRSMIGNGNDNLVNAASQTIFNYYNFTAESKQVYMNEVARMVELGQVEEPSSVEDGRNGIRPVEYSLSQNYPNPFNPTTTISFSLAKSGFTTLKIYNVMGQHIETIVNKNMEVGYHRISFDAASYSSGVYFYLLESGDYRVAKKMMLMK